jgi:hypothetical protein
VLSSRSHLESSFDEISCSSRIVGGYYDKSNNYWGAGGRETVACAEYLVVVMEESSQVVVMEESSQVVVMEESSQGGEELLLFVTRAIEKQKPPFLTDTFWQESSQVFNAPLIN